MASGISAEQLEQKYKLELEIVEGREVLKNHSQDKFTNVVKLDNYNSVLGELAKLPDRKTYQALGRGFILRKNEAVKKDYSDLVEETNKDNADLNKKIDSLTSQLKEKESHLLEMIKYLKIGAV